MEINPKRSIKRLAVTVIQNDFPLHIVRQPAFIAFVKSLDPHFKLMGVRELEKEIANIYERKMEILLQDLGQIQGKVCLTIGLWSTCQTMGYISLACRYIDKNWKLNQKLLNFFKVPFPNCQDALCECINRCLTKWNMRDNLFNLTVENHSSSHIIYSAAVQQKLSQYYGISLRGDHSIVQCYDQLLNMLAKTILSSIQDTISKICETIMYVKAPSYEILNHWGSTYKMLKAALGSKHKFSEIPENKWYRVEIACEFLEMLYEPAQVVSSSTAATSDILYHHAWKMQFELSRAVKSNDPVRRAVVKGMYDEFDRYWKDCSLMLAMCVVMNPTYKLRLVEYSFSGIYEEQSKAYVQLVTDEIAKLYQVYVEQEKEANHGNAASTNPPSDAPALSVGSSGGWLVEFDKYLLDLQRTRPTHSEMKLYLEEALVPLSTKFDLLNWWQEHSMRFPTLSKMARDMLTIPMYRPSDLRAGSGSSIFQIGAGSRMLDNYTSTLHPELVEALFCAKDWLHCKK